MPHKSPFEYSKLLERARQDLPEELSQQSRWSLPQADVLYEGRTTIIRNWREIYDALRRDYQHVLSYLLRELGTAGDGDQDRVVFTAKLPISAVQERLQQYVDMYVMCEECHRPDTHLTKDGRVTLIKCEACGAHKPVKARKRRDEGDEEIHVRAGATLDIAITDVNEKGVPFGTVAGVKVFVPGAKKGETVKAQIERVMGTTAVAKAVT